MAQQGKLVLPAPEDAVEFAAVIVDPPVSEPPIKKASRSEIIFGAITIRLEEGASAARIAAVAHACAVSAFPSIEPRADHGGDQTSRLPQGARWTGGFGQKRAAQDPFTGAFFVFRSRKADLLKLIYGDSSGLVMP